MRRGSGGDGRAFAARDTLRVAIRHSFVLRGEPLGCNSRAVGRRLWQRRSKGSRAGLRLPLHGTYGGFG
jgi:hypothetical protein